MTTSATTCTSHHHACDCREQKTAVLIKAALDAATELGLRMYGIVGVSKSPGEDRERQERRSLIVERTYNAIEALGVAVGENDSSALEEELHL